MAEDAFNNDLIKIEKYLRCASCAILAIKFHFLNHGSNQQI